MECVRNPITLVVELWKRTPQWSWGSHLDDNRQRVSKPGCTSRIGSLYVVVLVRYWGKQSHILWFTRHFCIYSLPWSCFFISIYLENSYSSFKNPVRRELCGSSLPQHRVGCSILCVLIITPSSTHLRILKAKKFALLVSVCHELTIRPGIGHAHESFAGLLDSLF